MNRLPKWSPTDTFPAWLVLAAWIVATAFEFLTANLKKAQNEKLKKEVGI